MPQFIPHAVALAVFTFAAQQAALAQSSEPVQLPTVEVRGSTEPAALNLEGRSPTASRLGLTLRETPATVEVLTQDVIQQRGARTFSEALRGAAGLAGGGPPSSPTTLSLRGFNTVSYLYDGVRSSGAGVTNRVQDTWNYERIEILKGPASVLYGDSAVGGLVNFVTKRPDRNNPGQEAMLSYGSYGSVRAGVGLGGAFGEGGAYRIDYSHNDSKHGTVARSGEKIDHLTTGVSYDFGGSIRLDVSFDYLKDDNRAYWGAPLVPAAFATDPTSVVSTPDGRVVDRRLARNNYNILDDENSSQTYWLRARLGGKAGGGWSWRNELSANKADRVFRNAETAVFVAPGTITRDQTLITHDQNFLFNRFDATHQGTLGGMSNRFVVGGEASKTDFDSLRRFSDGTPATAAALRLPSPNAPVGFYNNNPALTTLGGGNRTDVTSDAKTWSAFAEDALKLTPQFTLVGGLRHDHIEIDRSIRDLNVGSFARFGTGYSANSVRLGAVYDFSPQSTVYAQYTDAVVPVGSLFLLSASQATFPLSRGKQFEVGVKNTVGDTLEWTAAVYQIKLDNVLSRDQANPTVTVNNGSQSSRGVELASAWRATRQLTLAGNLAVLDARFDSLIEAGGVSRVGNVPTNVPERVANVFATYRLAPVPVEFYFGLNHVGKTFTDTANTIRINQYTTADAAVSYRAKPAVYTFRVRNLTDKLYANYAGRATSQVLLAPGRTYEVSANVAF